MNFSKKEEKKKSSREEKKVRIRDMNLYFLDELGRLH